jgi:indole-3-glycerol phosphate synthase
VSGFLEQMAAASSARSAQAQERRPPAELRRRASQMAPAPALPLSAQGFDVIAELKLRSPAQGVLGKSADDWLERVTSYARAGAAAVSVLTEPSRFDGALEHLEKAAARLQPFGVPTMRKDFLVDAYQVYEARVAGAGGVLVILRMLPRAQIVELLDTAAELGLFVLLEAFDRVDLDLAHELATVRAGSTEHILIGVNCRDLKTLHVLPGRLAELAPHLPKAWPAVAESGVATAADARDVASCGYRLALIGTALMAQTNPAGLLGEMLQAARTART